MVKVVDLVPGKWRAARGAARGARHPRNNYDDKLRACREHVQLLSPRPSPSAHLWLSVKLKAGTTESVSSESLISSLMKTGPDPAMAELISETDGRCYCVWCCDDWRGVWRGVNLSPGEMLRTPDQSHDEDV